MATNRALVIAARQPDFIELLEEEGYEVEARTRPLDGERPAVDVAVVFRGRLIGRTQAALLAGDGVPVVEVLSGPATSSSRAGWIRVSNRIAKPDLVQIVHALADLSHERARSGAAFAQRTPKSSSR